MSGAHDVGNGITHPPIDDLLSKTDSKYSLVIYAAKRARQINAYYSQLGEGLLEYVGPLVETRVQEKPLSIALREIDAGLLRAEEVDPAELRAEAAAARAAAAEVAAIDVTAGDIPVTGDSDSSEE
ncbi:DNA-directed RNA polymerase subunit omega [Actinobacteria bacterium YIM 96077]|uniref:DNA-directed RNA polymerase subunit omega n=1 Tax=Phytoactinopolyspora halophila TaxID=1981511 RepID=A0A329QJE9_9ACTN|nr:DNA-directed RNA polymerase subunit omega [Phytoactinopolyspora halophila]AYY13541.1 DNA-directed RNA polymerase subunit omega [Actinobacteria bacterium YIM 96077]RAW12403.1 DNA-directed RNA polymerase subunit omega [Phytoactinopolyspora halophila]